MKIKCALLTLCFAVTGACGNSASPDVRPSALAGYWYPSDGKKLAAMISGLLSAAEPVQFDGRPLIAILPHAGYAYSGAVAAAGYRLLGNYRPGCIFIMGPSHRADISGCAVNSVDYYETPLGKVKVARKIAESIAKEPLFSADNGAFDNEHCIEIQLPFLQTIFGKSMESDIPIVPILTGDIQPHHAPAVARTLGKYLAATNNPLLIISTDFTHYGPRFGYLPFPDKGDIKGRLNKLDAGAIDCILKKNAPCFSDYCAKTDITICGRNPILIALSLPIQLGKTALVKYDTSCNITGECGDSVSYAAILIGRGDGILPANASESIVIPEKDRRFLIELARKNIRCHLLSKKNAAVNENAVPLSCRENRGVFVTLTKNGELRGCIGTVYGLRPLWRGVLDNSYHAAFSDPRFPPVQPGELGAIRIEISVLTEPRPVASPQEIVIGRDGIIIEMNGRRGLLLPQVAVEFGWTLEEFLTHGCRKAGLPDDAWRNGAVIHVFQALVFGDG